MDTDRQQWRLDDRTGVKTGMQTDSWQDFNTEHTGTTSHVTLNFVTVSVPVLPREYITVADDWYPRIIRILCGKGQVGKEVEGSVRKEIEGHTGSRR